MILVVLFIFGLLILYLWYRHLSWKTMNGHKPSPLKATTYASSLLFVFSHTALWADRSVLTEIKMALVIHLVLFIATWYWLKVKFATN